MCSLNLLNQGKYEGHIHLPSHACRRTVQVVSTFPLAQCAAAAYSSPRRFYRVGLCIKEADLSHKSKAILQQSISGSCSVVWKWTSVTSPCAAADRLCGSGHSDTVRVRASVIGVFEGGREWSATPIISYMTGQTTIYLHGNRLWDVRRSRLTWLCKHAAEIPQYSGEQEVEADLKQMVIWG